MSSAEAKRCVADLNVILSSPIHSLRFLIKVVT
jgi:hypothetical protein